MKIKRNTFADCICLTALERIHLKFSKCVTKKKLKKVQRSGEEAFGKFDVNLCNCVQEN